jgi:uncharacterized protein YciI
MRFAAMFFDELDPRAVDADLTRRHFDYLGEREDRIVAIGGLRATADAPFCGSLWIIEADSLDEARSLMDGDPYCVAGLRPDRRLFVWNRPNPATSNRK